MDYWKKGDNQNDIAAHSGINYHSKVTWWTMISMNLCYIVHEEILMKTIQEHLKIFQRKVKMVIDERQCNGIMSYRFKKVKYCNSVTTDKAVKDTSDEIETVPFVKVPPVKLSRNSLI